MQTPIPPLKEMVTQLIGTPSVSSTQAAFDQSNADVIDLIANWLQPLGFEVTLEAVNGRPGKMNLIARYGSGTDGLLLSGHSDTVPFDDHLWHSDPFSINERDDRWYGLGSCDMKSFFALAIHAARPLMSERFERPLVIMATADEESSMSGAKQLTRAHLPDVGFAVIGEPTGLVPVTRHKGIVMLKLRVEGTSGHSSDPSLGKNAIEGVHTAISELMAYRSELMSTHADMHFDVPYPTLNLGCIHGGDNPNRICDHAELSFDFRNPPSMDMSGFVEDLSSRIHRAIEQDGFTSQLELLHEPVPAFENADSALCKEIESLLEPAQATSVAFGTEAPYFRQMQIDTVVVGPGSINQAHQPDEYLSLDQIEPATNLLQQLIRARCLTPAFT